MLISQIPTRMQLAWAKNAAGAYIRTVPVASQIGIQDGAASFNDGFVPDNFTPVSAGGVPPFGQDMNGVLSAITAWLQWIQAGNPTAYDSTFATAIAGYPLGAVLQSAVTPLAQWQSYVDGNLTNPDDPLTSVGWQRVGTPVGTPTPMFQAEPGFILATSQTIGSASSGAAQAAASTLFLFVHIWNKFSNSQCPIFTSAGAPTTRGANAVADFNANKRLQTPLMQGLGLIGCDSGGTTYLTGVPITSGNATTPGSTLGENLHALIIAELAAHTHANSLTDLQHQHAITAQTFRGTNTSGVARAIYGFGDGTDGSYALGPTALASSNISITNASVGSGTAHNTVERNMTVFWGLKA